MSHQIFSREIHIEASIPEGMFRAFMAAQTKLLGIRGNVEKTAKGFKCYLEGDKESMEKLKNFVEKAEEFASKTKTIVFSELKEIKQYTTENFNCKIQMQRNDEQIQQNDEQLQQNAEQTQQNDEQIQQNDAQNDVASENQNIKKQ